MNNYPQSQTIHNLNRKFSDYYYPLCLSLSAVCIRIIHAFFYFEIRGDAPEYLELSHNLAKFGKFGYLENNQLILTAFRPILHPWIMSWFWQDDRFLAQPFLILQAIFGGGIIFFLYLLLVKCFPPRIALTTCLWCVFSPFLLQFSSTLLTEPSFAFFTIGGIYFLSLKKSITASIFFALSALTRPIILPFLAFVVVFYCLVYFIKRLDDSLKNLKTAFLTIIFTVLFISPWCIRNTLLFGKITLTQSSGYGTNLLYGTEQIGLIGDDVWSWILIKYPIVRGNNEVLEDRERGKLALEFIKQNPQQYIKARLSQYPRLLIDSNSYILKDQNQSASQLWREKNLFPLFFKAGNIILSVILICSFISGFWLLYNRSFIIETFPIWSLPFFVCVIHLPMWIETRYFYSAYPFYLAIAIWVFSLLTTYLINFLQKMFRTLNY